MPKCDKTCVVKGLGTYFVIGGDVYRMGHIADDFYVVSQWCHVLNSIVLMDVLTCSDMGALYFFLHLQ